MTTFERDLKDALEGNEIEILKRRKAEIENLAKAFKTCRNGFRRQCITQELVRLQKEYAEIDSNF